MSLEDPSRSPDVSNVEGPAKEFLNFLFYKRIARAWGWVLSKIDEYLSEDDYSSDSRTASRVNALDKSNNFSLTSLSAWAGAFFAGIRVLLVPVKKLYQYAKWRKDPINNRKPVFTVNDFFYLCIDATIFALAVVAAVFVTKFLAFIFSLAAAGVTFVAGVVQCVQGWKNNKNKANSVLTVTVPSLCLVAAGLILFGAMLGPAGFLFMMVGAGIGLGATILAATSWIGGKLYNYTMNKNRRREFDEALMKPANVEQKNDLTLREKITRMSEVRSFLKENKAYDRERYQKFFNSEALVNYLRDEGARKRFRDNLKQKQAEASRTFLRTHPLTEKKEIPLDIIVEHVIKNPSYAKRFLQTRYGTTLFCRRNFRKELSLRKDLVQSLRVAAAGSPELARAIKESRLEKSRHFRKHAISSVAVRSHSLRFRVR
ncbi:MAG: hypothetical protein SFW07_07235 [Gammaproteobacteria bacterium]|nr:hypothetical protein [Gammaproteobacteria bacterium]